MNTVPVFGIILAALLLGEVIDLKTIGALFLVLAGLVVARQEHSSKSQSGVED